MTSFWMNSFHLFLSGMPKPLQFHAEEGENLTVEWRFSSEANIPISSVKIHCLTVLGLKELYHLDNSVEESQHEQFAGRVQSDKEALRAGSVRLQLSRVTVKDSGRFLCRMLIASARKVQEFHLNITEAVKRTTVEPTPTTLKTPSPPAEGRWRPGLYVALLMAAAAALMTACRCNLSNKALQKKQDLEMVSNGTCSM